MLGGVETSSLNDEARMPNVEGNPNALMTKRSSMQLSIIRFCHSVVIRHSDFVIFVIFYDYEPEHEREQDQ